jgi:hypothetical protein
VQEVLFVVVQMFVAAAVAALVVVLVKRVTAPLRVKVEHTVEATQVQGLHPVALAQFVSFGPEPHVRSQAHAQGIYK